MRRLLVTGSRHWTDASAIERALRDALVTLHDDAVVLVHGAGRGADQTAAAIWSSWGHATEAHPAKWSTFGAAAGPIDTAALRRVLDAAQASKPGRWHWAGKRVEGDGFERNWEDLLESRGTWQGEP